jgi:hypothetical protein
VQPALVVKIVQIFDIATLNSIQDALDFVEDVRKSLLISQQRKVFGEFFVVGRDDVVDASGRNGVGEVDSETFESLKRDIQRL